MLEKVDFTKMRQGAVQLNLANIITSLRFPLLIVVAILLYQEHYAARLAATWLVVVLILMDTLDGVVVGKVVGNKGRNPALERGIFEQI